MNMRFKNMLASVDNIYSLILVGWLIALGLALFLVSEKIVERVAFRIDQLEQRVWQAEKKATDKNLEYILHHRHNAKGIYFGDKKQEEKFYKTIKELELSYM